MYTCMKHLTLFLLLNHLWKLLMHLYITSLYILYFSFIILVRTFKIQAIYIMFTPREMPLTMSDINIPEPDFRPTMLNPRPLLGFFVNSTSNASVIFVVSAETPPFLSGTHDSSLSTIMVTFGKFNVNNMLYVSKQIMPHRAVCNCAQV